MESKHPFLSMHDTNTDGEEEHQGRTGNAFRSSSSSSFPSATMALNENEDQLPYFSAFVGHFDSPSEWPIGDGQLLSLEPRPLAPKSAVADNGQTLSTQKTLSLVAQVLNMSGEKSLETISHNGSPRVACNNNQNNQNRRIAMTTNQADGTVTRQQEDSAHHFNNHQDVLWYTQYQKLIEFKHKFGHCCVPITFIEDEVLARWVKRQRYQCKRYREGNLSATCTWRIQLLDSIGFIWNAHAIAWQEKFNDTKAYAQAYGHCNIASCDPSHARLSTWVKCQRRQYKLFMDGQTSNMTYDRIAALNSIGFVWMARK